MFQRERYKITGMRENSLIHEWIEIYTINPKVLSYLWLIFIQIKIKNVISNYINPSDERIREIQQCIDRLRGCIWKLKVKDP